MQGPFFRTQYQIECRSLGQSMAYFRFFSFKGQHHLTGSHSSFVCALHETYKKNEKNGPKSFFFRPIKFFIEVAHLWLHATFCLAKMHLKWPKKLEKNTNL